MEGPGVWLLNAIGGLRYVFHSFGFVSEVYNIYEFIMVDDVREAREVSVQCLPSKLRPSCACAYEVAYSFLSIAAHFACSGYVFVVFVKVIV